MDEKDLKNNKDNQAKGYSDLSDLVSGSLSEINDRYDEEATENVVAANEGVISDPKDGALPDQGDFTPGIIEEKQDSQSANEGLSQPQPVEKLESEVTGFGSMNVTVEDEEAQKIGQQVDSQLENNTAFKTEPKERAEVNIISTAEEKADRYKDTSLREEVKKKELVVTPRKKKAVRTYRDFAIENAKSTGGSLASMIMAEREKDTEKKRKSSTNPKNVLISVLSVVFVALGIAGVVAAYFVVSNKQESIREANSIIITPNPQITSEFSKELFESDINFRKLTDSFENDLDGTATPIGSIKQVYFTTSSGESLKFLVTTQKFLETLNARVPSALLRTLSDDFTLGIYSTIENSPFLIFKVASFPTAVEGMLDWETEMILDLDPVLKIENAEDVRKRFFEDIIVFNKDARAILDSEGNIAFAYSFIDRETILIFKDSNTLKEVISRLQNTIRR